MGVFTKLCIISILLSTFLTLCDILQLARGEDELFAHPGLLWNIVKYRALLRNISLLMQHAQEYESQNSLLWNIEGTDLAEK